MSKLRNKLGAHASVTESVSVVKNLFAERKNDLFTAESANKLMGLESLSSTEAAALGNTYEETVDNLRNGALGSLLSDHFQGNEARINMGLEAAAVTLIAAGDPEQYHQTFLNGRNGASASAVSVDTSVPGVDSGVIGLESFAEQSFDKFVAESVLVNALSVGNNDFEEAFFPTEILEAGQSGVEVKVSIAYAYNRTKRASNGKAFEFEKRSLIHALEDHTLLEGGSTEIFPRGDLAANDDFLVDAGVVANSTETVNGVEISTRPLKFGAEVDLLAVSAHPGLVGDQGQNETDMLDANIQLGTVYLKATVDDGTNTKDAVFAVDTSGIPGALFTRTAEGSTNDSSMNLKTSLSLNSTLTGVNGTAASGLGIESLLGLAAGDAWTLEVKTIISGTVNTEYGNMAVFANQVELGAAYDGQRHKLDASGTEYKAVDAALTLELVGYMPKARRVNANLRQRGILIDNGESNTYYYPISIGSPLASVRPVSVQGGGTTVEGLSKALRTRSSNAAVSTLLKAEAQLSSMSNDGVMPVNTPMIGSMFVRPQFSHRPVLDVKDAVAINRSGEGYDDVRAMLVDAVTTMADKLALESGYLAALEQFTGAEREYEIIVGTDPRIAGFLMKSGDGRTFGEGRDYRIVSTLDSRMQGRIYVSFRRKTQTGIDPMSFGAHLYTPALVHEVANSYQGGATVQEVQVQPRELHTATLPILGRIDVQGLDEFYVRS